jgi:hypothetical protein
MYWTWGKDAKKDSAQNDWMRGPMNGKGIE